MIVRTTTCRLVLVIWCAGAACHANASGGTCSLNATDQNSLKLSMKWDGASQPKVLSSYIFNATIAGNPASSHTINPFGPSGAGETELSLKREDDKWPVLIVFSAALDEKTEWECDALALPVVGQPSPDNDHVYQSEIEALNANLAGRVGGWVQTSDTAECKSLVSRIFDNETPFAPDALPPLVVTPSPISVPPIVLARLIMQDNTSLRDLQELRKVASDKNCIKRSN
jgi:hypothetical protein